MSGRKVELDEAIVPSPELESRSSKKSVPVIPTPISEETNDVDTTRKRPTSGAPVLPTNGALLVRH